MPASDAIAPTAQAPFADRAAAGNALVGAAPYDDPVWPPKRAWSSRVAGLPAWPLIATRSIEHFLAERGFERAPWLAVAFGMGIALWFALPAPVQWIAVLCACAAIVLAGLALGSAQGGAAPRFPHIAGALVGLGLMIAAGCVTIWAKSALAGTPPLASRGIYAMTARVIEREEQPALGRVRLRLAARLDHMQAPIEIRLNLAPADDDPRLVEGASIRLRARLNPPGPPTVPGGYEFAQFAWFDHLAATGSPLGSIAVLKPADRADLLKQWQRQLSAHVRARLAGSPGALASAFASGDRGGIAREDDQAMRDAGLTHLLSISGLHVSAVIALAYVVVVRVLALWPWLALRVRLPLVASTAGALTGLAYTLLTGAEVPTVRSCVGALLVLAALTLGRSPLSLRLLAFAGLFVMTFWPEAVVGPGFQMSFGSVMAIIALHGSAPARRFLAHRDEASLVRIGRHLVMLLLTGVVIDIALMPMALYHFHRAGLYGAAANVVAIPLTTFVSMPMIALALVLDLVGAGAPAWWLAGKSLALLLAIAHLTASKAGAVIRFPPLSTAMYLAVIAGELWLALWAGRVRLWGLVPIALGLASLALLRPPDVLISGDGRQVGVFGQGPAMISLRGGRGGYMRQALLDDAGLTGQTVAMADWPTARCNSDFCAMTVHADRTATRLLLQRSRARVGTLGLVEACAASDVVVSERSLPLVCRPRWFKADRALFERTGGLAIDLPRRKVTTVSVGRGRHGWERWIGPDNQ